MCLLNWCYKHFKKPKEIKACRMDPSDEAMIVSDNVGNVEKCICGDLRKKKSSTLLKETVHLSYYPCPVSTPSSNNKVTIDSEKSGTKVGSPSASTTASSMPISFESGSEETTENTDDDDSEEEDYEIEFSEEQEFCGNDDCPAKRSSGEPTTSRTESSRGGSRSRRESTTKTRSKEVSSGKSTRSEK
ncbi:hypothetical protein JTB14_015192 [Gonioctena quinquepunctata]|nr:hypothetical protein JTB14_015192 [Gonioctena quinquepunctata]